MTIESRLSKVELKSKKFLKDFDDEAIYAEYHKRNLNRLNKNLTKDELIAELEKAGLPTRMFDE